MNLKKYITYFKEDLCTATLILYKYLLMLSFILFFIADYVVFLSTKKHIILKFVFKELKRNSFKRVRRCQHSGKTCKSKVCKCNS